MKIAGRSIFIILKYIWIGIFIIVGILACKKDTPSSPTLSVPILTTVNVSSITVATAQSGGNITSADQRSQRVAYVGVQHQHPQLQTIKQPMTQESVILLAILPVYQPILPIT